MTRNAQHLDSFDVVFWTISMSPNIIDEFGYLPVSPRTAHLLFQLVAVRYETGSILLTSNRGLADWGRVLGDDVVATAILDWFLHHRQVITI